MGAELDEHVFPDMSTEELESSFATLIEERAYDFGHAGYTGTFAECVDVDIPDPTHIYNTREEAFDSLSGVARKWESAQAARFHNKDEVSWLVIAICSS